MTATVVGRSVVFYGPQFQSDKDAAAFKELREAIAAKDARIAKLEAEYHELIMAVGRKYDGETRHQTALRYIKQAESVGGEVGAKCDEALK